MQKKLHFVVVCGYGCNIDSSLAPYLGRVVDFLGRQIDVESVILCGGETQKKSFPGKTEAQVMFDYLSKFNNVAKYYILEDESYTTHDNIKLAAKKIKQLRDGQTAQVGGRPDVKLRITVFCEAQRDLAVEIAARHFMRDLVADFEGDIRTETYSWERKSPGYALWKANMMWLAIKFPAIARQERDKRFGRSHSL